MSRLPNSPHAGRTPKEIATADRRIAAVREVVDELLANTQLPPTEDRAEAVIKLGVDEITEAAAAVCIAVGDPSLGWIDMATSALAAEFLFRLLEARPA